jgi:hypothetical protein
MNMSQFMVRSRDKGKCVSQLLILITVNHMTQNGYNDRYVSWNSIELLKTVYFSPP